jgi:hypothetical protein
MAGGGACGVELWKSGLKHGVVAPLHRSAIASAGIRPLSALCFWRRTSLEFVCGSYVKRLFSECGLRGGEWSGVIEVSNGFSGVAQ